MKLLNLACGPDYKEGWINVDLYPQSPLIVKGDITKLHFEDNYADKVLCNYVFEHLSFPDEKKAFHEVYRVLKSGGELIIKVPDFEDTIKRWLAAKDEWRGFYKLTGDRSDPEYGFGWGNSMESKWGVIITHIFGSHSSPGLFHQNGYTKAKLTKIFEKFNYKNVYIETAEENNRGYPMVALTIHGTK